MQHFRIKSAIFLFAIFWALFAPAAHAQKSGAFYWGDGDGSGSIAGPDLNVLYQVIANPSVNDASIYTGYPQSRYRQDLDGNGSIAGPDANIMYGWAANNFTNKPGNPDRLLLDGNTHPTVGIGDSVTLQAYALSPASVASALRTGLGVNFQIIGGTCTTGAEIYGYDVAGGATVNAWRNPSAYHYLPTRLAPDNGRAWVRVRRNSCACTNGTTTIIKVYIPSDAHAGVPQQRFPSDLVAQLSATNSTPVNFTITWGSDPFFVVTVDDAWNTCVLRPANFSTQVDYPGIDATRAFLVTDAQVSLNGGHDELSLTVKDTGSGSINRLWVVATEVTNAEILNADALNAQDQAVMVYGPFSPGQSITRTITLNVLALPVVLELDALEVDDRIAYSTNKDRGGSLNRRIWSMDFDKNLFLATGFATTGMDMTYPNWSPGMEWLAFGDVEYGVLPFGNQIYVVHPDGSHPTPVTPAGKWSEQSTFFPDGKYLAYMCQDRSSVGTVDICMADVKGAGESDILRGDGYYWDGSAYQQYKSDGWYLDKLTHPVFTADGTHLLFLAQETTSAPSPVTLANRMVMVAAPFSPDTHTIAAPPNYIAKMINGDTISTSSRFLGLGECLPSLSPDGSMFFCFLREYVLQSGSWNLDFYGIGKVRLNDLLAAGPSAYFGSYLDRVYDIRSMSGYSYANYPAYVPQLNGVLFSAIPSSVHNDSRVDLRIIQVDSSFRSVGWPTNFLNDNLVNYTATVPLEPYPGFYK